MSYFCLCPKTVRDALPGHDFTFKCKDGDVRAHMLVLMLQSCTIKDSIDDGRSCSELAIDYNTAQVELALDYIYGCINSTSGDIEVKTIPLELYDILSFLQVDHLTDQKYYHIHDLPLENVNYIGTKKPEIKHAILNWLMEVDKMGYHMKLVHDVKFEVCGALAKIDYDVTDEEALRKMAKLDVDTLRMFFEFSNNMNKGDELRTEFLAHYMMDDCTDKVREEIKTILLPRTPMVSSLHNKPALAAKFGLSSDIKELLEYQLRSRYFYDDGYDYTLVKSDDTTCTLRVTSGIGAATREIATVDVDPSLKESIINARPGKIYKPTDRKAEDIQCSVM